MELGQDWIKYRDFMSPKRRMRTPQFSNHAVFISDDNQAVRVLSDSDALTSAQGSSLSDVMLLTESRHSSLVIDSERLEKALFEVSKSDAYALGQIEAFREKVKPTFGAFSKWQEPFLVQAMHSWWGRFLPSSFGIYIALSDNASKAMLLIFKKGKLESFGEPDLSSFSEERKRSTEEIVKYLKDTYSVPIQGLRLKSKDWDEVSEDVHPWKKISQLLRTDAASLVPFRVVTAALIGTKAVLGS